MWKSLFIGGSSAWSPSAVPSSVVVTVIDFCFALAKRISDRGRPRPFISQFPEWSSISYTLLARKLTVHHMAMPLNGKETEPRNIPLTEHRRQGWQKLDMYMMSERRHLFSGTIDIFLDSRLTIPRFFLGNATASKVDFEPNLSSVTHVRSWCARLTLPRIFQAKFQCHMSYWMHLSVVKPSVRKKLVMVALAIWNM